MASLSRPCLGKRGCHFSLARGRGLRPGLPAACTERESGREGQMTEARVTTIPVLCRFWKEGNVWNGTAEDLAVAVFGKTFEEATANLREALQSHLDSAFETGLIAPMLAQLEERAKHLRF